MPKRVTAQTIILFREGKRVKVPPNRTVDLTAEELDDIKRISPGALKIEEVKAEPAEVKLPAAKGADKKSATDNEL